MKKTSRVLTLAAAALIAVSAFAGCGNSSSSAGSSNDSSAATSTFDTSKTISVITREQGSGTRDAFVELTGVLVKDGDTKTDNTAASAITVNGTEAVITNVKGNDAAIGYISLGSLNDTVKAVKIEDVEATAENVKSGDYKISRPFNIAYKGELEGLAKDFVDFIMSADGQKVVSDNGYVTVSENAAYSGSKPSGKIVIAGSSSVSPVMEKLIEAYKTINTGAEIELQTTDSSSGMTAAIEGTCDIGMASRELKDNEVSELKSETIAKDGIAVIVNTNNTVESLTIEQVKAIYTGETKVWSDVIK
ncbi:MULTISPECIES: substrate-binding domain-containing protein [unclassified Ruminococcus]|uniref:substrate-binding domain-containing protein n=1 Tax=unclassified Ruminococcus TaxID=2608920 RepID=UPI00210A61C1|nr:MULTISPECIES: substrate-binding domain-containing protein [unclassified Ruminococcus]MCQ4022201.1 phosphate ABC transporter substrate-binding protein [Ruminococcus sp. zg-924]MCQ4115236.1 phosphate ABC transporter substrate-binding protein [Ruminococcus sp. zg-921]